MTPRTRADMGREKDCNSCGGTGWWWLNRSWFTADGFAKVRCHLCKGSGKSDFRDDIAFVKSQADIRQLLAERTHSPAPQSQGE